MTVIDYSARTSRTGARVEIGGQSYASDNLRPPAPLDDPQRAERVALGLIDYLDDRAALMRIRDAASRALLAMDRRDPGDEDDLGPAFCPDCHMPGEHHRDWCPYATEGTDG